MVTPRVPSIETSFVTQPAPASARANDVVFIPGPYALAELPANAAAVALGGPFRSVADAAAVVGADGLVYDAIAHILGSVDCEIYTAPTLVASGDTIPTVAQTLAALALVEEIPVTPTVIYAPGQTSGAAGTATAASDVVAGSGGTTGIAQFCERLGCVAVLDSPWGATTVAEAATWAANNLAQNLRGVFNRIGSQPPGGYVLGASLRRTAMFGRGAGDNFEPITGGGTLEHRLSYNPRAPAGTDVATLLNAGLTTVVRTGGQTVLLGDQFRGVDSVRRFWSVTRSLQHLEHVLEATGRPYMSLGLDAQILQVIADAMERAGRALIPDEIRELTVIPHPTLNNEAARLAGRATFVSTVTARQPIVTLQNQITLRV